ncbi:phage N-6-adenine-methyltransferase, partial [Klebsiella pneumoniae]|nr:phage N-6-adenine-methyltransferase [Klebsiella pneumoniae]
RHFNVNDDGLAQEWQGRVWCNPPFGREAVKWLRRMADHGNGIALIPARTETAMFYETVWARADAVLFMQGRPHFHYVCGRRAPANSGAPI